MTSEIIFLGPGDLCTAQGSGLLRTLLGTCVSVCVWHPSKFGIMCHYLLPIQPEFMNAKYGSHFKYGNHALEEMFKILSRKGIDSSTCQWWIFGGASKTVFSHQIGKQNFAFAQDFLHKQKISRPILYPTQGPIIVMLDVQSGHCTAKETQE